MAEKQEVQQIPFKDNEEKIAWHFEKLKEALRKLREPKQQIYWLCKILGLRQLDCAIGLNDSQTAGAHGTYYPNHVAIVLAPNAGWHSVSHEVRHHMQCEMMALRSPEEREADADEFAGSYLCVEETEKELAEYALSWLAEDDAELLNLLASRGPLVYAEIIQSLGWSKTKAYRVAPSPLFDRRRIGKFTQVSLSAVGKRVAATKLI